MRPNKSLKKNHQSNSLNWNKGSADKQSDTVKHPSAVGLDLRTRTKCWILSDYYYFFFMYADPDKVGSELGNGLTQWRLNEQLFPCPVCGKVFGRQQTLSRHLSLHTGENSCSQTTFDQFG